MYEVDADNSGQMDFDEFVLAMLMIRQGKLGNTWSRLSAGLQMGHQNADIVRGRRPSSAAEARVGGAVPVEGCLSTPVEDFVARTPTSAGGHARGRGHAQARGAEEGQAAAPRLLLRLRLPRY